MRPIVALIASATVLGVSTLTAATVIILATGTATSLGAVGGLLSSVLAPAWLGLSAALAPDRAPAAEAARRRGPDGRDRTERRPAAGAAEG